MAELIVPPVNTIGGMLVQQLKRDDMRFLSQLRQDFPLVYIDTLKAIIGGDIYLDDRSNGMPVAAQAYERCAYFLGKADPDYRVTFAAAEFLLSGYPGAHSLEGQTPA